MAALALEDIRTTVISPATNGVNREMRDLRVESRITGEKTARIVMGFNLLESSYISSFGTPNDIRKRGSSRGFQRQRTDKLRKPAVVAEGIGVITEVTEDPHETLLHGGAAQRARLRTTQKALPCESQG